MLDTVGVLPKKKWDSPDGKEKQRQIWQKSIARNPQSIWWYNTTMCFGIYVSS